MKIAQYDISLTDEQWALLEPMLPQPKKRGRPPTDRRRVIDAICYILKGGSLAVASLGIVVFGKQAARPSKFCLSYRLIRESHYAYPSRILPMRLVPCSSRHRERWR